MPAASTTRVGFILILLRLAHGGNHHQDLRRRTHDLPPLYQNSPSRYTPPDGATKTIILVVDENLRQTVMLKNPPPAKFTWSGETPDEVQRTGEACPRTVRARKLPCGDRQHPRDDCGSQMSLHVPPETPRRADHPSEAESSGKDFSA